MENNQFYQTYGDLKEKIFQERLRAKRIGNWIWFFLIFICLLMLFIGAKWYWFPIIIGIAFLFGSLYSYNISKKIERETGLNIQKQELVLMGESPFIGQSLSSENYQKLVKWMINESDKKNNFYTKEAGNEDRPFYLISDEEAYEIKRKGKRKFGFKLFSKKTLIILVILVIGATLVTYVNHSLESKRKTIMVQKIRNMFPALSQEAAEKFVSKANDSKLTDEEFLIWADELAAKGEVFLSYSQKEEMASLWWKAVGKLPAEQQDFIQSVAIKMLLGQQITFEENEIISIYVGHGFSLLSQEDKDKYLYLRSKALEEALRRE